MHQVAYPEVQRQQRFRKLVLLAVEQHEEIIRLTERAVEKTLEDKISDFCTPKYARFATFCAWLSPPEPDLRPSQLRVDVTVAVSTHNFTSSRYTAA